MATVLLIALCISSQFILIDGTSYKDVFNFYDIGINCTGYCPNIFFPRADQSEQLGVDVNFTLLNIGEFNEEGVYLQVNGLMDIIWEDH